MRLIPGKTKVQIELFRGITLADILVALAAVVLIVFVVTSSLPGQLYIVIGVIVVTALLEVRLDAEPNYLYILHILRHFGSKRRFRRAVSDSTLTGNPPAEGEEAPVETPEVRKARLKAERDEYNADEKLLRSHKLTKEEEDAIWLKRANRSAARREEKKSGQAQAASDMSEIIGFTGIKDGYIEYGSEYYGAVIAVPPVEFRFFSEMRRTNSIEGCLGRMLRAIPTEYAVNIVKLERPVLYDAYLANENRKIDDLRASYEQGAISEAEMKARVEVLFDRIYDLRDICYENKVIEPCYYIVLYDSDKNQLDNAVSSAIDLLRNGEMNVSRLNDRELAVFLKYSNGIDFDERDVEKVDPANYADWAMPEKLEFRYRTVVVDKMTTHNLRVISFPALVDDAWLASVMSIPATKVVVKCRPMEREKAVRGIDRSLQELRGQYNATGVDSKRIELQDHIDTLSSLLTTLQGDNESLLEVNVYVTAYDAVTSRAAAGDKGLKTWRANINNMKRVVRRAYMENNMRLIGMEFDQLHAFIGSQINAYDPMARQGRGIPSNSVAACYPWIYAHIADPGGIRLGTADGVPVFIDFFRRDSERVNSNMVIVGKSGSGKSYATKSLLTNLAADDSKIFILDPENEYTELAANLHGKFINVGNAKSGRLNPFHIITGLDDDESDGSTVSGSYATHLQFLEEFFRQILPDCDKDALEYLNSLIDRMYTNMGITAETDLSKLSPADYPTFDDLYDAVLNEFQATDNEYIHTMLRTLMNYVAKFSSGGRNAAIWNGPSTVTTDENFTVFNFQSLLANRNGSIANAQMLLVLKYIDNEIIKNRDYNLRHKCSRKVVVVIDEAHVFIDSKYPVALDFMFQLAKRIRKYNGMQIVITQNIKDFVGSEEIARKSTAIINACQYSFIFSLAPNDMGDLCRLYEKAGGINESEQEQIVSAPRGQAFTVMSPQSRSTFRITVPPDVESLFSEPGHVSAYFNGEDGRRKWEEFLGDSRAIHERNAAAAWQEAIADTRVAEQKSRVSFVELDAEAYDAEQARLQAAAAAKAAPKAAEPEKLAEIPEIPDDPAAFERMRGGKTATGADTEQMLTDLLDKLSYENMLREIRRSVREELERELADRPAASPAAAEPAPDAADDSLFAAGALFGAAETDTAADAGAPAGAAEDEPFDIMKLLMQEADSIGEISPIETMIEYGEETLVVTLEELMQYNATHG